jgi:hypothetical protein
LSEHDDFSPRERQALASWTTPDGPGDFPARVLARVQRQRTSRGLRSVAAVAVAAVLVGGFFAARLLSSGGSTFGAAHGFPNDGGSGVEVNPLPDGVRS